MRLYVTISVGSFTCEVPKCRKQIRKVWGKNYKKHKKNIINYIFKATKKLKIPNKKSDCGKDGDTLHRRTQQVHRGKPNFYGWYQNSQEKQNHDDTSIHP